MTTRHGTVRVHDGAAEGGAAAAEGPDELLIPESALAAARAADEKLGRETVILAMGRLFGAADAFVVTSGRNARQVRTLVDEIERQVKAADGRSPTSVEGLRDGTWVLMDYGDVVVHVFLEETRAYYDLEHLWSGAPRLEWRDGTAASTG